MKPDEPDRIPSVSPEDVSAASGGREHAQSNGGRLSAARIILNATAVLVALISLAPIGIMVAVRVRNLPAEAARTGFWLLFLSAACVGAFAPKKPDGESPLGVIFTMIVIFVVIMNLGGCMAALGEVGRATSG